MGNTILAKRGKVECFSKRRLLLKQIGEIVKERLKYPAGDEMDADMKRLKYGDMRMIFLLVLLAAKRIVSKSKRT